MTAQTSNNDSILAKFEPENGKVLFFIGQDLGAIGGLEDYNKGYVDHFSAPAGFTVYSNLSPGTNSYGYITKGLDGLKIKANWGAGDNHAQAYLDSPVFNEAYMAIGLSFVDREKDISVGQLDTLIIELAQWIKDSRRPVFLRLGYEFDGWDWNHYKRKYYLKSWKRIHSIFKKMRVDNAAFVWQSKGNGSGQDILNKWYPGDDYVDWCGYSYFGNPDTEMLDFARKHKKPVFIAEATPVMEVDGLYFNTDLKNEEKAVEVWHKWFLPFFQLIKENKDVIKAFSYINVNWSIQPMWINNPTFQQVDSRIQVSKFISEKWMTEISKPIYIKSH